MKSKKIKKRKDWLDIACGNNLQQGFTGCDITKKGTKADIELDLLKFPWPFKDNSIKKIFSSHFIEHIPHGDSFNDPLYQFMDEIYRILKPGGDVTFVAPYYTSQRAIQDPTHHRSIGEATFLYFQKPWRKLNKLEHYPVKCDFEIVSMNHAISEEMTGKPQEAIMYNGMHFWNIINDLIITLRKPKNE